MVPLKNGIDWKWKLRINGKEFGNHRKNGLSSHLIISAE
jgi:hypothetical protein